MVDNEKPESKRHVMDEKILDKEEEKSLKEFDFYHGFLPREDLIFLLRNDGDYLLRVSEVDNVDPSKVRREIILSVLTETGELTTNSIMGLPNTSSKLKNVIVRRQCNKYYVELSKLADSLKELIEYYQTNFGYLNKIKFTLRNPIRLQYWEFLHSDVKVGRLLGEGAYGEVRSGTMRRKKMNVEVAVKLTKGTGDLSKTKIKEMMREARLMRNFKHKNIVRIYGVAVDEQPLYIILELVKGGALNIYLRTNANSVDIREKIAMCLGSALGIEYLHKQNCIHMDLAARNCLYSEDKVVKISDFGLSRIGSQYTIRTAMKLPIKWLAPETITTFTFSLKTDVFSYGVMVYEIFADGGEPWDGVTNAEVKKGLTEGRVLTLPMSCPEKLRNFIRDRVYTKEPGGRATMSEVIRFFVENMQSESLEMEMKTDEKDKTLKEDGERSLFDRLVRSPLKSVISDPSAHIESFEDKKKMFRRSKGFHNKTISDHRAKH